MVEYISPPPSWKPSGHTEAQPPELPEIAVDIQAPLPVPEKPRRFPVREIIIAAIAVVSIASCGVLLDVSLDQTRQIQSVTAKLKTTQQRLDAANSSLDTATTQLNTANANLSTANQTATVCKTAATAYSVEAYLTAQATLVGLNTLEATNYLSGALGAKKQGDAAGCIQ